MDEIIKAFDEELIERLDNVMKVAYPALRSIPSKGMFLSVIFTMIDQYAADYNIPHTEINKLTRKMCDFQEQAEQIIGPMSKSYEEV